MKFVTVSTEYPTETGYMILPFDIDRMGLLLSHLAQEIPVLYGDLVDELQQTAEKVGFWLYLTAAGVRGT